MINIKNCPYLLRLIKLTQCLSLGIVILIKTTSLNALSVPQKSAYDSRIRTIVYNPDNVVQLDSVIGIATHIVLEEDESYITHVFGDAQSYSFNVTNNHLFIKPCAENADTNLIVVTNRRNYTFRLTFQPSISSSKSVYQLIFSYPDSEFKTQQAVKLKDNLEQGWSEPLDQVNLNYTMSGDIDIAPINVWDNNGFTNFKFLNHQDIPAIYMVDGENQESIVNHHVIGAGNNITRLHKVNAKWILRLGERALAIYNEAITQVVPPKSTGTASPVIERTLKGRVS